MGCILQTLVSGVCVDGGHQTLLDAECVVQDLSHRSEAVGGAGCVGDDVVVSCIVLVVVHAHDEGAVDVLTGSGEDNLLSASLDVCLCLAAFGEETGGLEDYVNAQVLPGEVLGVTLSEDLDFLAVNNQCAFLDLNLCVEATHDRVVLEQVCQGLNIGEVVDCDDLEADALGLSCAEEGAADAAEAVDCYAYSHWSISLSVRWWRCTNPMPCGLWFSRICPCSMLPGAFRRCW